MITALSLLCQSVTKHVPVLDLSPTHLNRDSFTLNFAPEGHVRPRQDAGVNRPFLLEVEVLSRPLEARFGRLEVEKDQGKGGIQRLVLFLLLTHRSAGPSMSTQSHFQPRL
jgi:hypothetical protein